MASESFEPRWAWPSGMDAQNDSGRNGTPPADDEQSPGLAGTADGQSPGPTPTQRQRHYKPRTCRICLEVVNPTTDIDDSLAGRVFSAKARVRYVSEDPELGRLISPCKCKGSQKYVHEGCLQAWRSASPLSDRNYWRCPTCHFEYRVQRLRWGRWLSSKLTRATLTVLVVMVTVFFLGFVADPIINFCLDPFGSIFGTLTDVMLDLELEEPLVADDEPTTWSFHFLKGFLSLGLLGFLKTVLAMSPWNWYIRVGGRRRRGTGRDRLESINWALVVIGILTFLGATWKFVNHLSARALEKASDRVVDVQEDNPDEDEQDDGQEPSAAPQESRKDR
ncbi:hypothetical protein VTK56DRAFT_7037 [Thermocarpiscus australiensis]